MPRLSLRGMTGISPRTGPTELQDNQAVVANNVKLQSGELRPWRKPVVVFDPVQTGVRTVYKLDGTPPATTWLEWVTDVDVVSGPINDTSDFRIYYTGAGTPKKTNYALATSAAGARPTSFLEMGVPAPTAAPTLAVTGGVTPVEDRAYITTFVSTFGSLKEESGSSPAALATGNANGTWTVSGFTAPPAGAYNITHRNIYRSLAGSQAVSYLFVAQIPIADTSYADTKTSASLGLPITTLGFAPPPAGLQGLVAMPNGMLVGFVDNTVWFCEPYLPHAWPAKYSLSVGAKIIGLGVYNNTLVVCTNSNPILISGNAPGAMSQETSPMVQPCVSKRSITYDQYGVLYASPFGLVGIGPGMQDVVSKSLYTGDEWTLLNPSSLTGVLYNNSYIGFYETQTKRASIVLTRGDTPPLVTYDFPASAAFVEASTGKVFAVSASDNNLYQLDADPINNMTYVWESKPFVMPRPASFACFQVDADYRYMFDVEAINAVKQAIITANAALFAANDGVSLGGEFNSSMANVFMFNASRLQDVPNDAESRNIQVFISADGKPVMNASVFSLEPIRMPSGFKAYEWSFRFSGNSPMRSFSVATSVSELKEAI